MISRFSTLGVFAAALIVAAGCKSSTASSEGKTPGDHADGGMGSTGAGMNGSMSAGGMSASMDGGSMSAGGSMGGASGSMGTGGATGSMGGATGSMGAGTATGSMGGATGSMSSNGSMGGSMSADGGMATKAGEAMGSAAGATKDAMGSAAGDAAGAAKDAAGAAKDAMGGAKDAAGGATMTDGQLVKVLMTVNKQEIAAGKWAEKHAKNAKVKAYGKLMVKAHTAWDKAAKATGVAAEDSETATKMEAEGKEMAASMATMKGAEADKAYVDHMVDGHQKVLSMLDGATANVKSDKLKAFLQTAHDGVQSHLDKAKELQSSMGAAAK